jgi:uncharacterized protein (DUF427 family)
MPAAMSRVPSLLTLSLPAMVLVAVGSCRSESTTPASPTAPTAAVSLPVATAGRPAFARGRLLLEENFTGTDDWRRRWTVEQQGGTVTVGGGRMVIADTGGCTVWLDTVLTAPVIITYEATVTSQARVSDLNCFWMATDPKHPAGAPATGLPRTGRFAEYDTLRTYYVGYGGNANTTTRFRRYDGSGARPLLPEHDLADRRVLLVPDQTYRITLVAAEGRVQYLRDGEVIFDWRDPVPLTEGRFGFRTVDSRIEIRRFQVWEARRAPP